MQLRGVLQTPEAVPVSRGFASLHTRDFSFVTGQPVDPTGQFGFGGLPDGTYLLEGHPAPGDPYTPARPVTVAVAGGHATPSLVELRLLPAALTGTVRTPDGTAPVTRTAVALQSEDGRWRLNAGVDQEGRFAFGRAPDGVFFVEAVPFPETGFGSSPAARVTFAGGRADPSSVGLRVSHPTLTGTVTTPDGEAPVSPAFVALRSRDDRFHLGVPAGVDGRFAFGWLPDGEFALEAIPAPTTGFGPSAPLTLTVLNGAPSRTYVELRVTPPIVTGTVVTPLGAALPNAGVLLRTPDFRFRRHSSAGPQGEFVLGGVPDGDYAMEAFPPPDSDYTASQPTTVTIRSQIPVSVLITVTLPSISGTVAGPDGQAVPRAFVDVYTRDRSVQRGTGAGEDGRFKVGGLPAGEYLLRAWPPPGLNLVQSQEITVTVTAGALTDVGQVMLQPVQLMGRLVGPDGHPIPRGGVTLFTPDRAFHQDFPTDLGGTFRAGGLPAGTYLLQAHLPFEASGLIAPPVAVVTLPLADPNLGDIAFLPAPKSIVGLVSRNTGGPVGGAMVFANRQSPPAHASTMTDREGQYRLAVGGSTWTVGVGNEARSDGMMGMADWIFTMPPVQVTFADDATVETRPANLTVTVAGGLVYGVIAMPDGSPPFSNTVFVSLRDEMGRGNGGSVGPDGSFRLRVPAGTYRLEIHSTNASVSAPSRPPITVGSTESINLGTITLPARTSTIGGAVRDQTGTGVAGIEVRAWLAGGADLARTLSITDGVYSLAVISGTWELQAQPRPDSSYAPYGPPARVTLGDGEERRSVDLQVAATDAILTGRLLDAGLNLLDRAHGFVYVLRGSGPDTRMVGGGPLRDGLYRIAIPSGSGYRVGVHFPPDAGFVAQEQTGVAVAAGETGRLDLTARAANAAIAGSVRTPEGDLVLGVPAHVFAGSPFGQRDARVEPATGTYSMSVVAGTWYVNAAVPDESGYAVRPAADNVVTVQAGQTATFDVTVVRADAAIVGTVSSPWGSGIAGAWVWASTRPTGLASAGPRFVAGDVTRSGGAYTLTLPAGDYEIRATLPKDRGLLEPSPASIWLATGSTATANLQFRTPSLAITGTVTLNGAPHRAHVTAFARGGARSEAQAGDDGQYRLAVASDDLWYVRARSVDDNVLYESPVLTVTIGSTSVGGQDLALAARATLPVAESVSFDASTMRTLLLSDGTRIAIPAGALAVSGTVTVRAAPKGEIPVEAQLRPIGLAYELSAVDANNRSIERFSQRVSIVLPYTDGQLAALGITADDLVPAYWDPNTGSWRPVDNVVVDKAARTVTISTDHFTDFAILGTPSSPQAAAPFPVYLPLALKGYRP